MNAALRQHLRQQLDQHARARHVCPSCGHFVHMLINTTGFCRTCTNEEQRGGPIDPHDHRTFK